jgi:hypothetical protein
MALVFPNTPATYKAFFEEFARTHKSIKHDDNPNRQNFCLVSIRNSISGYADNDIRAFLNKARSRTSAKQTEAESSCQMILEQMDISHNSQQLKVGSKEIVGSFAIITKPKSQSIADIDDARNECYEVGTDIVAAVKKFFEVNYSKGKLLSVESESIRIGENVGWRFDFAYEAYASLCYSASNFDNLTIAEL